MESHHKLAILPCILCTIILLAEIDITALLAIGVSGAVEGTILPYIPFVMAILSGTIYFVDVGTFSINPHCYTPMDNQYARSKEVYAESGAATIKVNPLSITCLAYTSNVDTPGAE